MMKEIRKYYGKMGEVTVIEHCNEKNLEYHVKHSGMPELNNWYKGYQKGYAISYAQFLAAMY